MQYFIDDASRLTRLLNGEGTPVDQQEAAKALEEYDMYADVYDQITDLIEPHVQRDFINPRGQLPASVVHSVEYLLKFWLEHNK